ncbi:methyltransferase domain-containing protein [Tropicimonas sp. TH_r6]|uniref:methyltransferase domain-containing protein n=1 Tax=Tropicimonas sp. TH_r6 TaxID=3082085 RepID=UPI0029556942|nr:methyltransferase domain-containing protein [Tropicimonas sp. TH_r6]MDV7145178.1 methyltransferase domain-containing protein [Tropicimonas sp. TH_r6]
MQRDWNPESYLAFSDLRLRPALDLLCAVPDIPQGDIVDLGCGAGNIGAALAARFPGRRLIGLDRSTAMLETAGKALAYDRIEQADITTWTPARRPALIYSNAVLHWLPEHGQLLPRLLGELVPGGVLAVQMPRQQDSPAQRILREVAAELFPERFDWSGWQAPVAAPAEYASLLDPVGALALWETEYFQRLEPSPEGHPVRLFSQSTAARPMLEKMTEQEAIAYLVACDGALEQAYPTRADGSVFYPFRRIFFTLRKAS